MSNNLVVGRGKVYLAKTDTDGNIDPISWRYMGNTPGFSLNNQADTLEHVSSDEGISEVDDTTIIRTNRTGTLVCDNIDPDNIALFFFGTVTTETDAGSSGNSENFTDVVAGTTLFVGVTNSRPEGLRGLENIVVKSQDDVTTFVLDTDYTVNADTGRVTLLSTGSISTGDDIKVEYDVRAQTMSKIVSGTSPNTVALRFESANAKGEEIDTVMPKVEVSPNGDFEMKSGENYQEFSFALNVQKPANSDAVVITRRPTYS